MNNNKQLPPNGNHVTDNVIINIQMGTPSSSSDNIAPPSQSDNVPHIPELDTLLAICDGLPVSDKLEEFRDGLADLIVGKYANQ